MSNYKYTVVLVDDIIPPSDIELKELENVSARLVVVPCISEDDVIDAARNSDAIMTVAAPITARVIDSLNNCRVIARYGTGLDNVDLKAATSRGIVVTYGFDYCSEEVSVMTVALLLACARRILVLDSWIKKGKWKDGLSLVVGVRSLSGKTLGLVGFGRIGRLTMKKMSSFGVQTLVYDPYVSDEEIVKMGARPVDLLTLLRESDYVSIHCPLTEDTRHMFREEQFRLMKKSAILINTSRGAIIHEPSLYRALKEGWIAAAGLDVMEKEPPDPENPLLSLDNVIITGHLAAATEEAMARLRRTVSRGVAAVLSGCWPKVIANPEIRAAITLREDPSWFD